MPNVRDLGDIDVLALRRYHDDAERVVARDLAKRVAKLRPAWQLAVGARYRDVFPNLPVLLEADRVNEPEPARAVLPRPEPVGPAVLLAASGTV